MASDAPSSAWHPALMPDHETDSPVANETTREASPETSPDASPDSLHNGTPLEHEPEPYDLNGSINPSSKVDAYFADDDTPEGGAWLASEQPASQPQADPSDTTTTSIDGPAPDKSPTKAQHGSSMSFARTVSHDISFGDDEDGDWNLPRTNTDPFKFMPPSDRTNSFPPVPPATSNSISHIDQPLPANQALDVLEETEKDWDLHEEPEETEAAEPGVSENQARSHHAASRSMGGDAHAFASDAETRYEEGVPLISSNETASRESSAPSQTMNPSPFADDDPNEDDFFKQVDGAQAAEAEIKPLERKSTSQVLGSLDTEPLTREETFDAVEEEEDDTTAGQPQATEPSQAPVRGHRRTKTQDLKAKWEAAFGDDDDDDFLLDDTTAADDNIDPAAFLGSDDEGLLDEDDARPAPAPQQPQSAARTNPYAPQQPVTPGYQPTQLPSQPSQGSLYTSPVPTTNFASTPQYGQPPPVQGTEQSKAESFANKAKGGYSSPYDLPSDIVGGLPKPRRRPSMQQMHSSPPASQPPPSTIRSASSGPLGQPPASDSLPPSSHGSAAGHGLVPKASAPSLRSKSGFFEELPMSSKPRPASRQSNRAPSPAQYQPQGPPQGSSLGPSPLGPSTISQPPLASAPANQYEMMPPPPPPSNIATLVAPDRVSPYAALQSGSGPAPPPAGNASRYSPAPAQPQGNMAPPVSSNRFSPAPSVPRQSTYSPSRASATTPPVLPHQPRTSSPLAHFDTRSSKPYGDVSLAERRSSSSHDARLNRVPSLPPTREVEEEDESVGAGAPLGTRHSSSESKFAPGGASVHQTPPGSSHGPSAPASFSSPKRSSSNYAPQVQPTSQPGFVPPPRAQTQSPSATQGGRPTAFGHTHRPSSAHSQTSPELARASQASYAPKLRPRGQSLTMHMVAPTDGREQDPLERWRGVPVFAWGMGGTVVTSFPKSVPRYSMGSSVPTVSRTLGEVKVTQIKDIDPLPERLAKFPGPLKGKSKKKDTISWLAAGIEIIEKDLPDVSFHSELSLEAKRRVERLLLWKILRVFIEHDGTLEGTPAVEQAVRDVLSPEAAAAMNEGSSNSELPTGSSVVTAPPALSDAVDAGTMEAIRTNLIKGEREAAVWAAVDKRLWGHAMLIANTVSPDLYKQVTQEFVRKEVNYPGHTNESMAALYKILSGNHDDCVDELVPSHARAGFQLLSTDTAAASPSKGTIDGLDKWQETLTLVLSNRSTDDVRGLHALGKLLAGYGRAEAAHICFMFSRGVSTFGGLDDPNVNIVLLGSDHKQQTSHFAKETEALELSEVYEYGLSLAGGAVPYSGAPHLAAYKLQHAVTLAEHGQRDKALQYCDAIVAAVSSQTKRSPYYNSYLAASVDDFMTRLKQAPKGDSGSWISKPSMNKVSDSMWNKFNKFVSGDDEDGTGAGKHGEHSPFNHIGTPTISRSPSVNNFEMYGSSVPAYGASAPIPAAPSKYAPASVQASALSSSYEPASPYSPVMPHGVNNGSNEYPGYGNSTAPTAYPEPSNPIRSSSYAPTQSLQASDGGDTSNLGGHRPQGLQQSASMPVLSNVQVQDQSDQGYTPPSYGYQPPEMNFSAEDNSGEQGYAEQTSSGYEPPSYQPQGYEPPSYQAPSYAPDAETTAEDGDVAKPKKKSFMDDDEDDIPALRPQERSKAEKDRENDELFRKAAEEDAKRAAEEKAAKKGWGFGGWFGKKPESPKPGEQPKAVRANLGEASSFVYDPELKRWVNKKPGAENVEAKKAAPPPPRAGPRSVSGTPPPPSATPPPSMRSSSQGPPPRSIPPSTSEPRLGQPPSMESLVPPAPAAMARSVSNNSLNGPPSAPPSRPGTSMSNASSIDDLLSAPGPRKGAKKPRKSGRYVDVMAK